MTKIGESKTVACVRRKTNIKIFIKKKLKADLKCPKYLSDTDNTTFPKPIPMPQTSPKSIPIPIPILAKTPIPQYQYQYLLFFFTT